MAGVINGMNRGPKFPPRARRAGAKLALTDPDQVQIKGNIQIQVVTSEHTDMTDLPSGADMTGKWFSCIPLMGREDCVSITMETGTKKFYHR